jgi:hypothetical protein
VPSDETDGDSSTFKLCREDETDRYYSEFDCIDEPTEIVERVRESKKAPRPMSLLELVDHFPGTIANQVPQKPRQDVVLH